MVQPLPTKFYALTAEKRPPEGAVGRCPAARCRALIPGDGLRRLGSLQTALGVLRLNEALLWHYGDWCKLDEEILMP
jgi:hypothetical protein